MSCLHQQRHLPSQTELEEPEIAARQLLETIQGMEPSSDRARLWLDLAELQRDRLHDPDTDRFVGGIRRCCT